MSETQRNFTQIKELLRRTRCLELLKDQAVIEIDAEDSIAKGCQVSAVIDGFNLLIRYRHSLAMESPPHPSITRLQGSMWECWITATLWTTF